MAEGEAIRDVERLVGANLKRAREREGMSQAELGEALRVYLGDKAWSRSAVSIAESGGRDFRATELLALALILRMPIADFFVPVDPPTTEAIRFPGGESVTVFELLTRASRDSEVPTDALKAVLFRRVGSDTRRLLPHIIEMLRQLEYNSKFLEGLIDSEPESLQALTSRRYKRKRSGPDSADAESPEGEREQ